MVFEGGAYKIDRIGRRGRARPEVRVAVSAGPDYAVACDKGNRRRRDAPFHKRPLYLRLKLGGELFQVEDGDGRLRGKRGRRGGQNECRGERD